MKIETVSMSIKFYGFIEKKCSSNGKFEFILKIKIKLNRNVIVTSR